MKELILAALLPLLLMPLSAPVEQTEADAWQSTECIITAYCPCPECCGAWSGGPTASGVMPAEGVTVAVDPDVIPLGSTVVIGGHEYTAQDTGAFRGALVDVYCESHQAALALGRRTETVKWREP